MGNARITQLTRETLLSDSTVPDARVTAMSRETLLGLDQTIAPGGIASGEAIGSPLLPFSITITATGVASGEAIGAHVLVYEQSITPNGLASSEAIGTAWVTALIVVGSSGTIQNAEDDRSGRLVVIAELVLDSETLYFSEVGITTPGRFYDPRIMAIGGINREIAVVPGSSSTSTASIELENSDRYFSKLRATDFLRRRRCNVLVGNEGDGIGSFVVIFTGVVTNWSLQETTFTLTLEDTLLSRFNSSIVGDATRAIFPHTPEDVTLDLVPLVMGTVIDTGGGALPAYRIDPAIGQEKYRYLAAQTPIKQVTTVYVYGVAQVSGFMITTLSGALEHDVTVIDFDADPLDPDRSDAFEVTWDGIGMTDDKTSTGNAIVNPVEQIQALWAYQGFAPSLIDTAVFAATAALVTNRGIVSGFVEIATGRTFQDILDRFSMSFNLSFYTTKDGKLGVSFPESAPASIVGLERLDQHNIIGELAVTGPDEYGSGITTQYKPNWAKDTWAETAVYSDTAQIAALGESLELAPLELHYVRDQGTQFAVVSDRLFFAQEGREVAALSVHLDLETAAYTLGQNLLLTHDMGIADDAIGYRDEPFRLIAQGVELGTDGARQLLRLISLKAIAFEPSLGYLAFKLPETYETNRYSLQNRKQYGRLIA